LLKNVPAGGVAPKLIIASENDQKKKHD